MRLFPATYRTVLGVVVLAGALALPVSAGPGKYVKLLGKAYNARQAGELERASKLYAKARRLKPERVDPLVGLAYVQAEMGREDAFWQTFDRVAAMGYGRPDAVESEPALAPYRDDPRYEEILARIRRNEDDTLAALRSAHEPHPAQAAPAFSSQRELTASFERDAERAAQELQSASYEERQLFERRQRMIEIAALERYLIDHPEAADREDAALELVRSHVGRVGPYHERWDAGWASDLARASSAFLDAFPDTERRSEVELYRLLAEILGTLPVDWDYRTDEIPPRRCEPAIGRLEQLASNAAADRWAAGALAYLAICLHDLAPEDKDPVREALLAYRALPEPKWEERIPFDFKIRSETTVLKMRVDGLPDFKAKILDGEEIGPDNLPGDYVLLEFWAPG